MKELLQQYPATMAFILFMSGFLTCAFMWLAAMYLDARRMRRR